MIVAIVSLCVSLNLSRKLELREATSALIGALQQLALNSDDRERSNRADRAKTYQVSVLFELAAESKHFDQPRFNAAMNWIFKASGMRREYSEDPTKPRLYFTLVNDLVAEATQSLRTFDRKRGKFDIADDLAERFGRICGGTYETITHDLRTRLAAGSRSKNLYNKLLDG